MCARRRNSKKSNNSSARASHPIHNVHVARRAAICVTPSIAHTIHVSRVAQPSVHVSQASPPCVHVPQADLPLAPGISASDVPEGAFHVSVVTDEKVDELRAAIGVLADRVRPS